MVWVVDLTHRLTINVTHILGVIVRSPARYHACVSTVMTSHSHLLTAVAKPPRVVGFRSRDT
jgi:hypothetical protein